MSVLAETRPENDSLPSPTGGKMLDLVELLSHHPGGLSSAEATRLSGFTGNLVLRLLQTLVAKGYANRRESDKAFVLSNRFLDLVRPQVEGKSLVLCANEALSKLRDVTGETVQLMIEADGKGLVMEQMQGMHALQVCGRIGMRIPLYSCAPGKAILASWRPEKRAEWFRGRLLKSFTNTTLSHRKDLERDLEETLARGYSIDRAEGNEGIHCVAAPILDPAKTPLGSITVMAPIARMPEDQFDAFGQHCMTAAREIEERLRF